MSERMNEAKTSGGSVTEVLPKQRARSLSYPFAFIEPAVPYDPPRPEPTYTFWKHPNDTFPMGNIVYFIYSAGRIKIGYSDGLRARLGILTTASPFPPVAVLVVKGGLRVERKFHARFAEDRLHGEWFTLSKKMRDFFRSRLCPVGRATLKKLEAEYAAHCSEHAR